MLSLKRWVKPICNPLNHFYIILFPFWTMKKFSFLPFMSYYGSSTSKESACNAGDPGSIPRSGRSPGEGLGYPLQYSGLENSMDCIIHGVQQRVGHNWVTFTSLHFKGTQTHREEYQRQRCKHRWPTAPEMQSTLTADAHWETLCSAT